MPGERIQELFAIEIPILQAPMAGANGAAMAIAVSEAGGLGALPCAMLSPDDARAQWGVLRQQTAKPANLNFFVHQPPAPDPAREAAWRARLDPYFHEYGVEPPPVSNSPARAPFGEPFCELVEELRPNVVSFHFGLPRADLQARVRASGAKIIASATTLDEARWLEARGVDAIIAQGAEAGGHRGMFLSDDIAAQQGLFALLPQIAGAVRVPVIAAGAIADARTIAAAFTLGADAVQIGTAYLFTPEATISALHRAALKSGRPTALTNIFTGRPARGIVNRFMREQGPMNPEAPAFPNAAAPLTPLHAAAEKRGSADFSPLWSGQSAALGREMSAADLTRTLWREAQALLR